MCYRVQSDEKTVAPVETTGLSLPLHFESLESTEYICVYVRVRNCVLYFINGLRYSVLLNFISSGSL